MSTTKQRPRPGRPVAKRRSYTPFIVVGVIFVVALGIALLASSGGDDEGGDLQQLATAGVSVTGDPLPPLPEGGDDPAEGTPAPALEGVSPAGVGTAVEFDEPTLVAFLAHWCPACQAELPEIVALAEEGGLDDLDVVAVLTGTDESAPNYPPGPWLEREGWTGRVLLDDEGSPAASAFGLTSYPYLVLVDGDGNVVDRNAGGLGLEGLRQFVAQLG
jgi:cytochrome c biogenesis protein CcmG, thiol:disulfide interchange protein DsbE